MAAKWSFKMGQCRTVDDMVRLTQWYVEHSATDLLPRQKFNTTKDVNSGYVCDSFKMKI